MPKIAIYPGSFDPITNGHIDIIKRSLSLFDKVIIAVNDNSFQKFLFTAKERVKMIKSALNFS
ncbi:adenylyltransferase/cytidyltransferase family protein, partial [Candidatus Aerophobetes bacterium]|nr:adenylyltransferase/cytidyltransferase family protein [Candidatus Aerophobetes bacterium]